MTDYWKNLGLNETWSKRERFNYIMGKIEETVVGDSGLAELINNLKSKVDNLVIPSKTSELENDSGFITEHQSLDDYITKSETSGLITNTGDVDTTKYLSEHQDISGKLDKSEVFSNGVFTTINTNKNGTTAKIWNESDGGGTQIIDGKSNVQAYTGVHEGSDGSNIYVQTYAVNKSSKLGTRININPDGAYYTKNKTTYTWNEADEIVTKKDLEDLISRIETLEEKG